MQVTSAGAAAEDRISPWEMFEAGHSVEQVLGEAPMLAEELRSRLLITVRRLMRDPRFDLFAASPNPNTSHASGTSAQA